MDPRFIMADTMQMLDKAGIDGTEFWAEINACESPEHAISICYIWQENARANA